MKGRIAFVAVCGVTGLLLAASSVAQTRPPATPPAASVPRAGSHEPAGDIDAAVDLVNRVRNRGETVSYKKGWHAGASYRITQFLSVLAEGSGDYRELSSYTANIYAYSGGVRFQRAASQTLKPFIQITMGAAQDNGTGDGTTNHYPVVAPGGGVDARLGSRAALRVRLDFPLYMTFGDVFKGTRVAIGLSVPFGTRR